MTIEAGDLTEVVKVRAANHFECDDCGAVFADYAATRVRESHGETTLACPMCGSGEIG